MAAGALGRVTGRSSRVLVAAFVLAVQLVMLASTSGARAASILWSLTATPLTATVGVQRVFTLTATNEDPLAAIVSSSEIGCVVLDVPANFGVSAAVVTGSNSGDTWHVDSIAGNRVTVHTDSGGDRLELLGWVRFTITATAFNTGSLTWNSRAFRQQDCTGSAALVGVPPIVVVTPAPPTPVPTSTPAPTPTSTATPRPTVAPTPRPTPTPGLTIPLPSLPIPLLPLPLPQPQPGPSSGEPSPSPSDRQSRPSSTARPTPEPSATPNGTGAGPSTGGGGGARGASSNEAPGGAPVQPATELAPRIAFGETGLDLAAASVGLIDGIGVWSVPAATLGVPGILLIIWVALQAGGALAWIPAVRRLRDGEPESR